MSVPFSIGDLLKWTDGSSPGGESETVLNGVSINTRTLEPGQLFVAIRGDRHDAHRFLAAAGEAGAAALLVERGWLRENKPPRGVPVIGVDDTTAALGALAAGHRAGFGGPLVAITGSNGKTTTKEMCHAILSVAAPCLKNEGNLNNEFGLPLTLLSRQPDQRCAVVELGMNHRGEIARLAGIAGPNVAVVTNVGTAHIEHLGSQQEIAQEKGDLIAALQPAGVAVINRDDERVARQAQRAPGRVVSFGRQPGADVTAEHVRFLDGGEFGFELVTASGRLAIRVRGLAETTVINALAAAAAALAAGGELADVATGLERHQHVPGRMACRRGFNGTWVIDDSYNANPQSMCSALESLAKLKGAGRGFAVLGDMGELGEAASGAHSDAGRLAARLGIDFLFLLGERADSVAAGALEAGMDPARIHVAAEHEELGHDIGRQIAPEDWILVKGSRAMQMERVVATLVSEENR